VSARDVVDARDRLTRVVVELSNIEGLLSVEAHHGAIGEGHWHDGIKAPLDRASAETVGALGGVLWALDHPTTDREAAR
jgi:hypothetical protein